MSFSCGCPFPRPPNGDAADSIDEAKAAFRAAGGWDRVRAGRQSPLPGKADEKASGRVLLLMTPSRH